MLETLLIVSIILSAAALGVAVVVLLAVRASGAGPAQAATTAAVATLTADLTRLREDLARLDQAARTDAAAQRQELASQLTSQRTELADSITTLATRTETAFSRLTASVSEQVQNLTATVATATNSQTQQLTNLAQTQAKAAETLRTEVSGRLEAAAAAQQTAAAAMQSTLSQQLTATRSEITTAVQNLAKENSTNLSGISDRVSTSLAAQSQATTENVEKLRSTVEFKLTSIQQASETKLEQMRATVDEKLSSTLNTRLGESFKLVSDRLEAVQAGFGEMKNLAGNVTDLRRVMTNVKTRGVWGEVQLANLLEQIFTAEQYTANFKPKPRSGEVVEFALRLPGTEGSDQPVYLPIDSKFPIEDYQRLVDAAEAGDVEGVKAAQKGLENRIYGCAKDIRDKYIAPPTTTNFAVLFLPTEALYAEVVKMPGLIETLTRDYKVLIQGPTNFSAFAMALLMGFRTLAIQKRSADIANLLGAIKTDFGKFGDLLGKVEDKLDAAKKELAGARSRSTQITKKLSKVEALPSDQATLLLPDPSTDPDALLLPDLHD
jgi:DNA recombination protein RmuC